MSTAIAPLPDLDTHVALWVDRGVIDRESAERILSVETELGRDQRPGRSPLVIEGLGYVGGVLVALGVVLLTAQLWDDWSVRVRLVLAGVCAVGLVLAGAAVPAGRALAGDRLRAVLWALATGAASFWTGLLAVEVLELEDLDVGLFVTGATAALALLLWRATQHVVQHVLAFAALAAFIGTLVATLAPEGSTGDVLPGLGLIALGAGWVGLALRRRISAYRLALVLGGVGVVVGASVLVPVTWGRFAAIAAVAALLTVGVVADELALLAVGTLGLLIVLPPVLMTWFPGAVAAPVVLLAGGACVVLVALRAIRRRPTT